MIRRLSSIFALSIGVMAMSASSALAQQAVLREYGWLEDTDALAPMEEAEAAKRDDDAEVKVYDFYTFEGKQGQEVRILAQSIAFDTVLVLAGAGTGLIEKNDDIESGGLNTNSQITATLPQDGEYAVLISGYEPEARGSYVLSVTDVSEPNSYQGSASVVDDWAQSGGECSIVRCFE